MDYLRRVGQPVLLSTERWTLERLDAAVERGPHPSAQAEPEFFRSEMVDMSSKGQWLTLPYSLVRQLAATHDVRLAPPGCIPQRDRRPRTIVDYTFWGLNDDTIKLAPPKAMQFGKTLPRLLDAIFFADPRWGPVNMAKTDVSDGFYRVWLMQ